MPRPRRLPRPLQLLLRRRPPQRLQPQRQHQRLHRWPRQFPLRQLCLRRLQSSTTAASSPAPVPRSLRLRWAWIWPPCAAAAPTAGSRRRTWRRLAVNPSLFPGSPRAQRLPFQAAHPQRQRHPRHQPAAASGDRVRPWPSTPSRERSTATWKQAWRCPASESGTRSPPTSLTLSTSR